MWLSEEFQHWDIQAELPDGTPIAGVNELRDSIMERPHLFAANLTEKLMLYALGREVEAVDMPTVRHIVNDAADESYAFFDIVQGIVNSEQFRYVQATAQALPRPRLASRRLVSGQSS